MGDLTEGNPLKMVTIAMKGGTNLARKPKITTDKNARADQRRRTEQLIEQTKDVDDLKMTPPPYFSDLASTVWKTVIPVLKKMETVKQTDSAIVEAFCINYEQMVTAYKDIQEHGQVQGIWKTVVLPTGEVLEDEKGNPRKDFQGFKRNPSTQILDAATAKLKALASELGLTPTSRASLINMLADKTESVDVATAMKQFFKQD